MSDTTAAQSRLEAFFRKRSDDPGGVRVVGYEPILGGYSRAMARVWVEDSSERRGYVVRADPPPGQAIIDTDRRQEWALLSALHSSGAIPLPAPPVVRRDGRRAWQPGDRHGDGGGGIAARQRTACH